MEFRYYRKPPQGVPTTPKWIAVRQPKDGDVYGDARIADTSPPRLQGRWKRKVVDRDNDPIVGWTAVECEVTP